ncbi:MAG: hypothetical protein KAJ18_12195, partial [Candidatus Omnitrophica bacterium]|nr:hypothetical protein [Candidatus Omnitrophota bacterium]
INSRINRDVSTNDEMEEAKNLCNNICIDFDPDKVNVPEGKTFGVEFLQSIISDLKFLTPTLIVSTGNGLHAWWHLSTPISISQWRKIQARMNVAFPVDGATEKPSGMMRLAGFVNPKHKNDIRKVVLLEETISGLNYKAEDIEACLTDIELDVDIKKLQEKLRTGKGKRKAQQATTATTATKPDEPAKQKDDKYPYHLQVINVHKLLDYFKIWYAKNQDGTPAAISGNQSVICIYPNQHDEVQDHPHGLIGYEGAKKGQYNCFCCNKIPGIPRGTIVDVICYNLYKNQFPGEDYSRKKHGRNFRKVIGQIDKIFPGFININFGESPSPLNLLKEVLKEYNMEQVEETEKQSKWLCNCPICKERELRLLEVKRASDTVVIVKCQTCSKDVKKDDEYKYTVELCKILGIKETDLIAKKRKNKPYSFRYSEPKIDKDEIDIVPMKEAFNVNNIASGKLLCFRARVSAAKDNAYAIPTEARFDCKDYRQNVCLRCGVFEKSVDSPDSLIPDPVYVKLDITNQELLDLIGHSPKKEIITKQIL